MELTVYLINAFSNELSGGNPACVIPLENWLTDSTMLDIANKNGVSETAFFIIEEHVVKLRWFTPDIEMDL
ncbi:MAG: PhzF family phenazine biosynthesis protein, partial [Bacteroidota bacterium]|nr:PhzF family phenazine biosynthesis protein [Bacteroidota bacterium]